MRLSAGWREAFRAAERWVLPGECLLCRARVDRDPDDPLICGVCRSRWRRLPPPWCARCGQPLDRYTDCRICVDWPEPFGPVRSAVWLDEDARRAVHLLKYNGWHRVADALAAAMTPGDLPGAGAALVPIPLGAARLRARGYNQSAKLAEALGRRFGLPVAACLVRSRETRTQTTLTPEEREANLRGAFGAAGAVPRRPILIDDVFTTGSTLRAAAGALSAAGAGAVAAWTFARAEAPLAGISRAVR